MKYPFIVFYGINNLGKSTQVDLLVEKLKSLNLPVEKIKYAVYDLRPTGLNIDSILRGKKLEQDHHLSKDKIQEMFKMYAQYYADRPELIRKLIDEDYKKISSEELQYIQVKNREQYEPSLKEKLKNSVVVAEDYKGTGIAWGMAFDVDRKWLEKENEHLLDPDIVILLDGKRFTTGHESSHRHENSKDEIFSKCRQAHLELAKKFGWNIVNANQNIEEVANDIWKIISKKININ